MQHSSDPSPPRPVTTAVALDHVVLVAGDVERTLAWYERHLGLAPLQVDEWRAGQVPFPSLRVTESTIIDIIPGHDGQRGHLDHVCFVVSNEDLERAKRAPDLAIVDEGPRSGARGIARSVYVLDPDELTVEIRAYPDTDR